MAKLEGKSFETPDEVRNFDKGKIEILKLSDLTIGRAVHEPGWKWSECVKPIVKTDSCQVHHVVYIVSGRMKVAMDDGSEMELSAGSAGVVPPGHDAWVVGDEACTFIDFTGMGNFATKSKPIRKKHRVQPKKIRIKKK